MMKRSRFLVLFLLGSAACADDELLVDDDAGTGMDGGSVDGSVPESDGGFVVTDGGVVLCGDAPCACSNGIDDDGDGEVDGFDTECTGPLDDDEGSFGTGIPGDNRDPNCQDCFFDGNSGSGDDGCRYATSCLVDGTSTSGSGACMTCEPSARCIDNCQSRTPNGCDCFGCCEVSQEGGGSVFVRIGAGCSDETLDDPVACPRCVQSTECVNECGRCELCPGKTEADLPADCGPMYACENGEQVCSPTMPCPAGFNCQLGCCLPTLI